MSNNSAKKKNNCNAPDRVPPRSVAWPPAWLRDSGARTEPDPVPVEVHLSPDHPEPGGDEPGKSRLVPRTPPPVVDPIPGPTDRTWVNVGPPQWGGRPAPVTEPLDGWPPGFPDELMEDWNERAAVLEFDGGLSRHEAERRAFAEVYDPCQH